MPPRSPIFDLPAPLPDAWWATAVDLEDDSHPAVPNSVLTRLVASGPHGRIVLAETMELASWSEAATEQVQVKLCQDPGCGVEHCALGSWIALRATECDVVIGPSPEATTDHPADRDEYAPPTWMTEHGPCLISFEAWSELVHGAEHRRRDGRSNLVLPPHSALPHTDEAR